MSRKRCLPLLLLVALAACASALTSVVDLQSAVLPAGSPSTIQGLVLDPSGGRLVGAMVTIQAKGIEAPVGVATDAEGHFAFNGLAAGEYEIYIKHKNSGARIKHFVVPPQAAVRATFRTSPSFNLKSTTTGAEVREGKDRIKEVHNL